MGKAPRRESRDSARSARTVTNDRAGKDVEAPEVAATKSAELDRRRRMKAVEFLRVSSRNDAKDGRFLEGTLANRADFPVYSVQVCVGGTCRPVVPSTLQPGAQATFSVPVRSDELSGKPNVTWKVDPPPR